MALLVRWAGAGVDKTPIAAAFNSLNRLVGVITALYDDMLCLLIIRLRVFNLGVPECNLVIANNCCMSSG